MAEPIYRSGPYRDPKDPKPAYLPSGDWLDIGPPVTQPSPANWLPDQPKPKDWSDLLSEEFYGGKPEAGFYSVFPKAYQPNAFGSFLRGSQTRAYNKYLSELPQNPNRSFRDFLGGLNLAGEFAGLAPSQRGENQGLYSPGIRFLNRRY